MIPERRYAKGLEVRAAEGDEVIIDGYASVTSVWYDVAGGPPTGWRERIQRGAFAKTLSEQRDAMFLLVDHEGLPVAATRNGTLILEEDDHGLRFEARIQPTRSAYRAEIAAAIQDGLLDSASFAFRAEQQMWNEDYTERTITEARLYEASVVKWPANPATVVQARDAARIDELRATGLQVRRMSVALAREIAANCAG